MKLIKTASLVILAALFAACGSGAYNQKETGGDIYDSKVIDGSKAKDGTSGSRVIIFNAEITIETEDTAALSAQVAALAAKYGGYVVSTSSELVVIRVEADKFEPAIEEIKKMSDDVEVNVFSEDVTEVYRDTQIRLENKLKARDRYLELLKKAENVHAALEIERELERLNGEIEELKGRINRLSHLAKYSTITVHVEEEVKPGPLGYVIYGVVKVVKWLFIRN